MTRRKTEEKPTLRQFYSTDWGLFLIFGAQNFQKIEIKEALDVKGLKNVFF
jgi:hypothetical protein